MPRQRRAASRQVVVSRLRYVVTGMAAGSLMNDETLRQDSAGAETLTFDPAIEVRHPRVPRSLPIGSDQCASASADISRVSVVAAGGRWAQGPASGTTPGELNRQAFL